MYQENMTTLPNPPNTEGNREISSEAYLSYSLEVLESLYRAERNMTPEMAARPAPHSVKTQLGLQQKKEPPHLSQQQQHNQQQPYHDVSSAHMAAVYDQFDGMQPVEKPVGRQGSMELMPPPDPRLPDTFSSSSSDPTRATVSSLSSSSSPDRLTSLSLLSAFSNNHMADLLAAQAGGNNRGTADSGRLIEDMLELVRRSESELRHIQGNIEDMNMDDFGGRESSYDLRFTGLSQERFSDAARSTDSTTSSALMRDTMLTIPREEYASAQPGQQQQQQQDRMSEMSRMSMDEDVAEVLLRLSRDRESNENSSEGGGDAMQM